MKEELYAGVMTASELERLQSLYDGSSAELSDFRSRSFDLPKEAITWMAGGCFSASEEQQMSAA